MYFLRNIAKGKNIEEKLYNKKVASIYLFMTSYV